MCSIVALPCTVLPGDRPPEWCEGSRNDGPRGVRRAEARLQDGTQSGEIFAAWAPFSFVSAVLCWAYF